MEEKILEEKIKLARASFSNNLTGDLANPWNANDIDKLEFLDMDKYRELVKACRFFYKHDSIASTVINKMVDIGITDIEIPKSQLSANELRIIDALKDSLQEFAENMALEFLISGLIIPEIKYANVTKEVLKAYGIKKYETLYLPVSMWLRDPNTIKINSTMVMNSPSYYVQVPEELIFFIMNDGVYPDNTKDEKLFAELKAYYPEFVLEVKKGARFVLLENDLIIRRRYLSNSPYPIPMLTSAIEALKHKRNLRRMDYAIASRVIGAIQLFKLGTDDFPLTEDQEDQLKTLESQMYWRNSGNRDVERVYQLFSNHTLSIEWIYPPFEALLDDKKYAEVNQDIIFSLGFPRILMTGETARTGTSDAEFATLSPLSTMENFRRKILIIINDIIDTVLMENNLKGTTKAIFSPINLKGFAEFVTALSKLYDTGNLSRTTFADALGYNFKEEAELRAEENELISELGVEVFSPQPFSPQPNQNNDPNKPTNNEQKEVKDNNK